MRVRSSKMRVFYFDRVFFRMKAPLALHMEIYTASRGFLTSDPVEALCLQGRSDGGVYR